MHELSVATRLVEQAVDAAADAGADDIEAMTVEVGKATHLNPEQVTFAVEMAAGGTLAADASVEVEQTEPRARCDCGWSGAPEQLNKFEGYVAAPTCPECESRVSLVAGEGCQLVSIEVPETANAGNAEDPQEAT